MPVVVVVEPGWVGCVGCVGPLLVGGALDVGALLDVGGALVWCVGGGPVGDGAGVWSVFFAGTLAGGGKFSIGWPKRSAFITAAQVAVG
jgi:hypothetical protein